jgi:serine/threonine-protein kinase
MNDQINKRERFGRYLILDHLVDGGMAKISRARFLGEQADKVVAIKMVQPQFSKDEAFKTMFMDEIKVTFGLSHPNVIQTYDYGIHAGQLFVAMEYCDGRNLKEFLDKLKDRKFVFPIEISIYIISQACQGLYYAHTFRDKLTGVASSIIHRDISPHNIMMSYDGAVKIIDFGIAKSSTNKEATQAGTIKGKLSYLAPEYLEGLELDPRYDQFALGITLWEMLCNKKLFKENNDLAVLKKIQECKIAPPSSINPNVPPELDEIVLKALSKDRTKRYDNLDQMNRALMKVLYAKFPDFNATDLSFFSQELFREEIKIDREKLFEFGRIDIKPYIDDLKNELEGGTRQGPANTLSHPDKSAVATFEFNFDEVDSILQKGLTKSSVKKKAVTDDVPKEIHKEIQKDKPKEKPKNGELTSLAILQEKLQDKTQDKTDLHKLYTTKTKTKTQTNAQASTDEALDNNKEKTSILKLNQIDQKNISPTTIIAALLALLIGVGGGAYYEGYFDNEVVTSSAEPATPKKLAKGHAPASVASEEHLANGTIILTHFDNLKMQVFIDGKKEEPDAVSSLKVPMKKEFILRVQIEGKKHFIKELRVENSSTVEVEIPEMPYNAYAYMNTTTDCTEGEIKFEIFGEKRSSKIPMKQTFGIALPLHMDEKNKPAAQTFTILFTKTGVSQEKSVEITVLREDQAIDLCEFL